MKENNASRYFVFFALLTIFLYGTRRLGLTLPVAITTSQVSSELSVVGEGKVDVTPDTLTIDVGITVEKEQSAEAVQNKLTEKNNSIVSAVKSLGIDEKDIKTSNYSVNPNYVYDLGKNRTDGFTGNVTVTIKTKKLDLAGKITQSATEAGATNIAGTRFSVENPEVFREQARDKAIANAKDQAQKLASSLGITLGRVTNIVESNQNSVPPIYFAEKAVSLDSMGRGGAPAPELQPGTQTVSSSVTLYFEKR
jgi:uncharacterized protein YggE